jgi:fatty acid desaturase
MICIRNMVFALIAKAVPGIDRERIWNRLDLQSPASDEALLEIRLMQFLQPWQRALSVAMLSFFIAGVFTVWGYGATLFAACQSGLVFAVPILLGLLVHGLFILIVHECTHGNMFGRPIDDWIGNGAMGLLLLPFLAGRYQTAHHLHHRRANRTGDTNWTPLRQRLFRRSRWLYALYEMIPVVNNLDRLRDEVGTGRHSGVLFAWICAFATYAIFRPPLAYWLLVVIGLNTINALRLWVEHFGHYAGRVSNTYYCPLGFGIGNHEVHHRNPRVPALVLAIGLTLRSKDGSVFSGIGRLLFDGEYAHFRTFQDDFTGDNV